MVAVVVAGFATLDYVARVEGDFTGRGTLLMRQGAADAWPRAGGAALFAGAALAGAGVGAAPLTWIGDDGDGEAYRDACRQVGVSLEGVATMPDAPSTRCLLIYNADGTYGCLLRPGPVALTEGQKRLAAKASWLAIAAGPPGILSRLLDTVSPATRLAWIAKDDPACFPPDLVARLARRADVVFCNAGERAWLEAGREDPASAGQLLFETRGAEGVRVEAAGEAFALPVATLTVDDATGAGDTFAGAALAVLVGGGSSRAAAQAGIAAAGALLAGRR
ncbi:carbohydrate kinase family protein [Caulobacter sp. RL271]|jgi:ribokinase|uniref:Carbohydrate kinase family protein n=1 Tax=Caulobacter segnis TaxID=88688 RepID=A0ABY4ZPW7_9CAUL|nr:carbohydrate kinase family protein [Caulobacter segnis]USQ94585.1 carbohydrate kinase family protein [Caulobacter segnis]